MTAEEIERVKSNCARWGFSPPVLIDGLVCLGFRSQRKIIATVPIEEVTKHISVFNVNFCNPDQRLKLNNLIKNL